MGNQEPSEILV